MPIHTESLSNTTIQKQVNFLGIAWGMSTLAYSIVYPFLLIYLHNIRGIPMSTAGLIFPIMGVAVIIGSPLSGILTDRVGRRLLLVGGPVGRSLSFFILALMVALDAPFALITAGLFFSTLLGKFFQNSANAYITDVTSSEERPIAFSRVRVGLNLGWMLGPAIGSFLAQTPFSLLFCLTAILCLGTSAIAYKFCPPLPTAKAETEIKRNDSFFSLFHIHDLKLFVLLFLMSLLYLSVSQYVSTLSIYSTKIIGINKNSLGFLYTVNGVMVILFLIPINTALKKVALPLRMGIGALVYVVAYLGFGMSVKWIHLALSIALMTVGEMISLTAIVSAVSQLAPSQMVGRYMGLHGLIDGLGWAVGPYFGALLFEQLQWNPLLLWFSLSLGALIAGAGFLAMPLFHFSLESHEEQLNS